MLSPSYLRETTIIDAFKENPIYMFGGTVLAFGGIILAIAAIVLAAKRSATGLVLGAVAVGAGVLTTAGGAFDRSRRLASMDDAASMPDLPPRDVERIRGHERDEANYAWLYCAGVGTPPILLGAVGLVTAAVRRRR